MFCGLQVWMKVPPVVFLFITLTNISHLPLLWASPPSLFTCSSHYRRALMDVEASPVSASLSLLTLRAENPSVSEGHHLASSPGSVDHLTCCSEATMEEDLLLLSGLLPEETKY
ncbi:hypothetical protein CHARACLAT_027122 [Characodon lateralis]|uniref:Uncharacterized protein n=1 Tax=Characodon lateralis TaxID=208331 RepID=A0ABU7EX36_9TELE|nr:hypothetical protein [Characodon lateralis]